MGQGFSLAMPSAASAGIDIAQLQDIQFERSIGTARFMKSIRGRHENGVVLVKVLVKPYAEVNLEEYRKQIIQQRKVLAQVPNALGFERVIETETNGYLVRQFHYSSLYDRLSTRPFLEDVEKKWLAFQLLCALRDCHAGDVYHGDIKAQNVLVTSWNWLYLTDFSSAYKPILLPDDNPGDFSYFFDTSSQRTCYIAPERFYAAGKIPPPKVEMTWAMDIFSAGCVIAQMFLESEIFTLAQLYKYRRGEYDPVATHLSVISDKDVRDMIIHMIQLNLETRYSAEQYLDFWKGKVFPAYFYNFLHQYMELITDPSSGNRPMSGAQKNMGESDDRIDRVYYDFDKISYFLGHQAEKRSFSPLPLSSRLNLSQLPVRLSIANHEHFVSAELEPPEDDGTLIFLTLIVSSIRTTARAASRMRACDILLAFSERLTDEAKLDRVLPYLMTLLRTDETDIVLISAIRTITQLLQLVRVPTPINSHVVVEYVLPRMEVAFGSQGQGTDQLVKATYASCLGSLASTGQRFLEIASSIKSEGAVPITDPELELEPGVEAAANLENVFDNAGRELFHIVESHTKQLVADPNVYVRRAFLESVPQLCMFFQESSNDILLTHLNTYLNDPDWMLRCAFFDTIVAIATFVGSTNLQNFIMPLMIQALIDVEESVVQAAARSLAQLAGLGLLSRSTIWGLVELISKLTMHPNIWVRESAAQFLSNSAFFLTEADIICLLQPLVGPYLKIATFPDFAELSLLDNLKKPLSRAVYEQATLWVSQANRGLFWKPVRDSRSLAVASPATLAVQSLNGSSATIISKAFRSEEDEPWLAKLRNLGMKAEDESKLLALREFLWHAGKSKAQDPAVDEPIMRIGVISLQSLGVRPQTVFFDDTSLEDRSTELDLITPTGPYTIADALLDASMTVEDDASGKNRQGTKNGAPHDRSQGTKSEARLAVKDLLSLGLNERASPTISPGGSSTTRGVGGPSDDELSTFSGPRHPEREARQQSRALSLLDRKDRNKSVAEMGTSDMNAFGEVRVPSSIQSRSKTPKGSRDKKSASSTSARARHSYAGTDPSIRKMLDRMFVEKFPRDVLDFGPFVQPISSMGAGKGVYEQAVRYPWRPKGLLVATFGEHRGPINRVVVSPDHLFFVTGGDDGTARVWDTARLERNITTRSRQLHKHGANSRVLALCFIENSHCFVSCASDGSLQVVRVDASSSNQVMRYAKLRVVWEYALPSGEVAVWCEHYKHETASVLVLATNRSRILGIDLRRMTTLFELQNPVHHGSPTCFCIDRRRNWLCLGTSHGIVDIWDLRFKMRLKGWGVPGKRPIYRITVHPTKGRGKWVCVSGGMRQGEVTVWDLEKITCREVFRTNGQKDGPKTYGAWDVDQDKAGGMLDRFATGLESDSDDAAYADRDARAMVVGVGVADDSRDIRTAYMVTGGSDKKLRFWDLSRVENSCVYSGLSLEEPQPSFTAAHPTTALTITTEKGPSSSGAAGNGTTRAGSRGKGTSADRPSRQSVVSLQQQELLQTHLDAILDVAILEYPYAMSVSVDRSGVVFVFQ